MSLWLISPPIEKAILAAQATKPVRKRHFLLKATKAKLKRRTKVVQMYSNLRCFLFYF
jgi:hypothetical protein